ncbi:MAG: 17 kDa surface antigen [candidate division NC10 bacterium CSP1-5]|nr:MAG: 17 kDa surface antigen [candidate division NC10 bacterium CSP1-5]
MRKTSRQAVALVLSVVLLVGSTSGCASLEQSVRENPGTVVGAAAGAAGGLLLGGLIFQSTTGALAGGLIGALTGGVIGHAMEAKKRDYPASAKAHDYTPAQPTSVRIEKVKAQPSTVKPGETVHLIVEYALLTQDPNREVSVTERREISTKGRLVGNPVLTVKRKAGTWASTVPLKLPANAEAGSYRVAVAVQAEGGLDSTTMNFTVR